MPRFLIVRADCDSGRGTRGLNLYRFLAIYHGRRSVELISSSRVKHGGPRSCDVLFVGMPTRLAKDDLAGMRFRRAVLFDYLDEPAANWGASDRDFFLSLTHHYWKAWTEPGWDNGLRFGVLPIRRHAGLSWYLRCRRALPWMANAGDERRDYDVAFIGSASGARGLNQRVEWLRELRGSGDRFRFWGGLVGSAEARRRVETGVGDCAGLFYGRHRVKFYTYFRHLLRSRVALTPAGNARWSYRHYEAIYAGATLVTADFRQASTLIPLPVDGMVHVPDGAPVTAHVAQALAWRRRCPELAEANVRFLEQYLHDGDYTRSKPALMDRFLAQLDG